MSHLGYERTAECLIMTRSTDAVSVTVAHKLNE